MTTPTIQFPTVAGRENDTEVSRVTIGAVRCDSVWYNATCNAQASMVMILCSRFWSHSRDNQSEGQERVRRKWGRGLGGTADKEGRIMTRIEMSTHARVYV